MSKIQRSRYQFCDVTITGRFQTGLETTTCGLLRGPSQLSTLVYSQLILRIYAASATNRLGRGAQTDFVPGRWKPQVRHWVDNRAIAHHPRKSYLGVLAQQQQRHCTKLVGSPK